MRGNATILYDIIKGMQRITTRKLDTLPELKEHLVYGEETGAYHKVNGDLHWKEGNGGFRELSEGDFWGTFNRTDGTGTFFRNERMYPDDPDRFIVFVNILGPTQARVHYALDGVVVEKAVYTRVSGVGVNAFDAFEEDIDNLMYFSKQHESRRSKWPKLFTQRS